MRVGNLLLAISLLLGIETQSLFAQFTPSLSSNETRSSPIVRHGAAVDKILFEAGAMFKQGLLSYTDNNFSEARNSFNKSVEVFLYSSLNIQREQKLQGCYNQVIETVYRIEFPTETELPQVRNLSLICGWTSIELTLADRITSATLSLIAKRGERLDTTKAKVEIGFNTQEFETSPLDQLSKVVLTPTELEIENSKPPSSSSVRIVEAKAGDTVDKVAARYSANAVEVARYNDLLPNSVLGMGRKIKLPIKISQIPASVGNRLGQKSGKTEPLKTSELTTVSPPKLIVSVPIGSKPSVIKGGRVQLVMKYFNEVLHDPYSMHIVRWSPIYPTSFGGVPVWGVKVKYRAKNRLGAYVLSERIFYMRNNRIVYSSELD